MQKSWELYSRYGGLIAVLFEWSALIIFYLHQPLAFDGSRPISYFATLPETRIVFSLFYLAAAGSFWLFASRYLSQHYRVPLTIFAFSMLGFAATAVTPFNPDNTLSNVIHTIFWQSSFVAFWVGMYLMARANAGGYFRAITLLAVAASGALLLLHRFTSEGSHLILPFEAGSWLICQLWIIWISLRSHNQARTTQPSS